MTPDEEKLLARRLGGLETFYKELMPVLVDFVDRLGIRPSHEVLNHAEQFAPYLETALADLEPADEDDRVWLTARVAYFVGEYFVQKYKGCWLVNDVTGSKSFARYVVGRFSKFPNSELMIDPFEVSFAFVGSARPRKLGDFLNKVDDSVVKAATLHQHSAAGTAHPAKFGQDQSFVRGTDSAFLWHLEARAAKIGMERTFADRLASSRSR